MKTQKTELHQLRFFDSNDLIGWNPKGKDTYDYHFVALYNYNRSGAPVGGHITYAFAFHDGQPVELVDEITNGNAHWTEMKNTDVEGDFEQIAKGQDLLKLARISITLKQSMAPLLVVLPCLITRATMDQLQQMLRIEQYLFRGINAFGS